MKTHLTQRTARTLTVAASLLAATPVGCSTIRQVPFLSLLSTSPGKEISFGSVTFSSSKPITAEKENIRQIHKIVSGLNSLIPSRPLAKIILTEEMMGESRYLTEYHAIIINLNSPDLLALTAHEMGHAIFRVFTDNKTLTKQDLALWSKIYAHSLSVGGLVARDSYYTGNKSAGHPEDNEDELFSSAIMAYILYGDRLISFRSSENERVRQSTEYIFVFLREKVFKGRTFSQTDPYRNVSINEITRKLNNGLFYLAPLTEALDNPDDYIRERAAAYVNNNFDQLIKEARQDPRFIPLIIKSSGIVDYGNAYEYCHNLAKTDGGKMAAHLIGVLGDKNPIIRRTAAYFIGETQLNDPRFVLPLIKALNDPDTEVRRKAAEAIFKLGIIDERFIDPLIAAFNKYNDDNHEDHNYLLRQNIVRIFGKSGFREERIKDLLVKALQDRDQFVRIYAINSIAELKIRDKRVSPLLINRADLNGMWPSEYIYYIGEIGDLTTLPFLEKLGQEHPLLSDLVKEAIQKIKTRETNPSAN